MINGLILLSVFILGMLMQYIFNLLDLFIQNIANKQTLKASEIQSQIDNLGQSNQELQPAIGFQFQGSDEQYYGEEENHDRS